MKLKNRTDYRKRRHQRVRKKLFGTPDRPRMCVFISNKHMHVQFVDDTISKTLGATSTQEKGFGQAGKKNLEAAAELGKAAGEVAKAKGISHVVFDRGGFSFEGRVQAIANAARESGLKI